MRYERVDELAAFVARLDSESRETVTVARLSLFAGFVVDRASGFLG